MVFEIYVLKTLYQCCINIIVIIIIIRPNWSDS